MRDLHVYIRIIDDDLIFEERFDCMVEYCQIVY
jgi:hypothetical protein